MPAKQQQQITVSHEHMAPSSPFIMKKTLPEISIVIAVASLIVILFACLGALIAMTVHGVDINIWINNLENPTERAGAYIATAIGIHAIATFYK